MLPFLARAAPSPNKGLPLVLASEQSDGFVTALDRPGPGCVEPDRRGSSAHYLYLIDHAAYGRGPHAAFHSFFRSSAR